MRYSKNLVFYNLAFLCSQESVRGTRKPAPSVAQGLYTAYGFLYVARRNRSLTGHCASFVPAGLKGLKPINVVNVSNPQMYNSSNSFIPNARGSFAELTCAIWGPKCCEILDTHAAHQVVSQLSRHPVLGVYAGNRGGRETLSAVNMKGQPTDAKHSCRIGGFPKLGVPFWGS